MEAKKIILIQELLETSSSSDEEEFLLDLRRQETVPHIKNKFLENIVKNYSDADFEKNFRVSRSVVTYLTERYDNYVIKRNYQGGRIPTSSETQILSFLWFSGKKTTIREISELFGMSFSNVHRTFNKVLNFITSEITPEVIKFPKTEEEKQIVADGFKRISGIPSILGCIDGSFITARTPKHKKRSIYSNKHRGISITLQGICDSKSRFLNVFAGIPSIASNSKVLNLSFIENELPNLCSGGYYLLGDDAYPLREYLITPYTDSGRLSQSQKNFNVKFNQSHVTIENSFCLLKCRFRQLMRLEFLDLEKMKNFVVACCTLHNLCINRGESLPEEIRNTELESQNADGEIIKSDKRDNLLSELGRVKRDELKNYLMS